MEEDIVRLDDPALRRFDALRTEAADAVALRFDGTYEGFDEERRQRSRTACREDIAFTLEFLRPVLEFGLAQPMVDYLRWLASLLAARGIVPGHVEQSLTWISQFYESRLPEGEAQVVGAAIERAFVRFREPERACVGIDGLMPAPWPECDAFEAALLAGERRPAGDVFERCLAQGHGIVEVGTHLVQPTLYAIGRKWQDNLVSVAREHLATAIAQSVMSRAMLGAAIPPSNGARVLLACVEGNHHSVGLQMVADAFQLAGWDVQYLGANTPTSALLDQTVAFRPALLGLSISFAQQLRSVKDIVSRLEAAHGADRPRVVIGGRAINRFPAIAMHLGADAYAADALAAVGAVSTGASALPA
jgi:methanogenic corrinoid protein MtbC1